MSEGSRVEDDDSFTCMDWVKFLCVRVLIVAIVCLLAFLIPNINILLTICGSVLGTIVNILLPVLFYNRAYNTSEKNQNLEQPNDEEENMEQEKPEKKSRTGIKVCSYIVLTLGIIIGIVGLTYACMEMFSG